jgi:hypothetical protein
MTKSVAPLEDVRQAEPESLRRNRDFGLLISGRAISYVGSRVQMFATAGPGHLPIGDGSRIRPRPR